MANDSASILMGIDRIRTAVSFRAHALKPRLTRHFIRSFFGLPRVTVDWSVFTEASAGALIMDDICLPPYTGPASHNDVLPLLAFARALNPAIILELGTAHGNTVANLCRICPDCHLVTVNAPADTQTGVLTTYELSADEIGRVYRQHGFTARVTQIYQNTLQLDLSVHLPPASVGLAIIDACHDTAYVVNDFHKVRPYMREDGVVLLHDTHPSMSGHLEGSYKACVQLRREGYDIRHIEDTWWGIWSPSDLDERLSTLKQRRD